MKNSFAKVSKI